MDGLRWLLLFFGVLVVAGVYVYGRVQRKQQDAEGGQGSPGRVEPSLGDSAEGSDAFEADPVALANDTPDELPPAEEKIVTVRIVARNHGSISAEDIVLNLRGIGMRHGRFGIFHRYDGNDEDSVVFSAASLVEPGSFDLATIRETRMPGISLFLVLPGPLDGAEAFDLMMAAARALRQSLDAELLDESGSTLSIQRERYLREEIIEYQHSNFVA